MPYSYKFAKVDISYVRFHMEVTPSQGQSNPSPNLPSLPALSVGIQNLPSRRRMIAARPHTGTEDTCRIVPGWPLSSTATTTPWNQYLRITTTFPRIIRQKPPLMNTGISIMTTTREKMVEDNRREGGGLPGWRVWGRQRLLLDVVIRTCVIGSLLISRRRSRFCRCRPVPWPRPWLSAIWLIATLDRFNPPPPLTDQKRSYHT